MHSFLYQTTSDTDAYNAFVQYLAVKKHFTTKTYDFHKYNGKVKTTREVFDKRPDKYQFHKLAQRKHSLEFLVANYAYGGVGWIGDLLQNVRSDDNYKKFIATRDSLTYCYRQDLDQMLPAFDQNFVVVDGQHPHALKLMLQGEIKIETLSILDHLIGFTKRWSRDIIDPVIWPDVALRCTKLRSFMSYDRSKLKKLTVDCFA